MFDNVNFFISIIAGVISFLSPCVFPLVPSFLLYLSGDASRRISPNSVTGAGASPAGRSAVVRRRVLVIRASFFVSGFTLVFVVLGYIFSSAATLLGQFSTIVDIVAGSLIVLLGLHQLFNIFRFLHFEMRAHLLSKVGGNFSALIAGIAFGAGWSPCIGPLLTSILLLASQSSTTGVGVIYLSLYGIGLGIPFILIAACMPAGEFGTFFKRHARAIQRASGGMLLAIGTLVLFGRWRLLTTSIIYFGASVQQFAIRYPLTSRWGVLALYALGIALSLWYLIRVLRRRRASASPTRAHTFGIVCAGGALAGAVALFVLEYATIIQTMTLLGRWLQFQGV